MSSSGWRRPQGAARQAQRHLRNAFSSLDMQHTEDSGSENSDNRKWPASLYSRRLLRPLPLSPTPFCFDGQTRRVSTGLDVCALASFISNVCMFASSLVYDLFIYVVCYCLLFVVDFSPFSAV